MSKFLKVLQVANRIGGKSSKEMLEYMARYKSPTHLLDVKKLQEPIKEINLGKTVGKVDGFATRMLGDSSATISELTKNVSSKNSLVNNVTTLGKNFGGILKKEVSASRFKTIEPEGVYVRNGKIEGKGLFKNFRTFDRKIEGTTTTGNFIVKKRKAVRPLAIAMTPAGFGAQAAIFSNKKPKDRIEEGVTETAMWSLAAPVASTKLITDMI